MLENLVMLGEKNIDGNESLKEIFNFKKKEIISGFKLGYSTQERIINTLKSCSENKIIELPNVIFYKNNKKMKIMNEVDRIITVEKDTKFQNFIVFSKTKFQKNKEPKSIKISEDEILVLEKHSCNFIEVKTSMNFLLNENKTIKNEYFKSKTPSEISSITSKNEKPENKICKNINKFLELFKNFNKNFKTINLIIIIDSYFQKKYINKAETFIKSLPKQIVDFNLLFVHIESDITYAYDLDRYQKIEFEAETKDKEIKKLKTDGMEKDEEIKGLKTEINKLNDEMSQMKNHLDALIKKDKIREIEENIRKEKFDGCLMNIIKENEEIIKQDKKNFIIGQYYNDSFKTIDNLISSKNGFNVLIDFKTFIRLTYTKENMVLIDNIRDKYISDLKLLSTLRINKLILLVDFVFILDIKKIMTNYFQRHNLIIKIANNGENILFLLSFQEQKNSGNKYSFLFEENILSYDKVDLNEISNLSYFLNYCHEIIKSINNDNLKNFPLYDPFIEKNHYFLSIIKTKAEKNGEIVVIVCGPLIDYEDLLLQLYENNYKYIIILFQSYYFEYDETVCNKVSLFYFKKKADFTIQISEMMESIYDSETIYLTFFGEPSKNNVAIIDKINARVLFKFKVKKNSNNTGKIYVLDENNIIDHNIKALFEKVNLKNNKDNDILIEEPFNIIYSYLINKYDKSNVVLLNPDKSEDNQNIQKIISTNGNECINEYLLQFLNNKNNMKYNLIISTNNQYLEDEKKMKHKFLNKEKLINIKNHLKEKGIFCFYLFLSNKYLEDKIREKLEIVFKAANIFIYNYKLCYLVICSNDY